MSEFIIKKQSRRNPKFIINDDNSSSDDESLGKTDNNGVDYNRLHYNRVEYNKMLNKIFPSKYQNEKVKQLKNDNKKDENKKDEKKIVKKDKSKSKSKSKNDKSNKDKSKNDKSNKKQSKSQIRKSKRLRKKSQKNDSSDDDEEEIIQKILKNKNDDESDVTTTDNEEDIEDIEETESSSSEDSDESDDESDDEYDEENKKFVYDIVFTIPTDIYEEYDEDDDSDYEDDEDESDDETSDEDIVNKKKKKTNEKEKMKRYQKVVDKLEKLIDTDSEDENDEKDKNEKTENEKTENEKPNDNKNQNKEKKSKTSKTSKEKKLLEEFRSIIKKNDEKEMKKEKKKNIKTYKKEIRLAPKEDEFKYFSKLEVDNQKQLLEKLKEIKGENTIERPYRIELLEKDIPSHIKAIAMRKINILRRMEPSTNEYFKIKQWIDGFMKIPFGRTVNFPISINDGIEKCSEFLMDAKKQLDEAVYGLDDAKMQVIQLMGQLISNPEAIGTAIAIKGPMGTGKTSLVKEGISKILKRPFAFIALGGATDSSFLEGHSYTYEGSIWGKIVDILMKCKSMNPVIYFDELDKVSDTPKGEEIIGILTHLTDTTQNTSFHDKYFTGIDFDLSKCLFIFSYNDETKINPILRDRMYRIQTDGYNVKDKITIVNNYLLKTIRQNVNFKQEDVNIGDKELEYIIENYTEGEKGVRNLKRCLEIIHTKLNLYRLMGQNKEFFEKNNMPTNIEFPCNVTEQIVRDFIQKRDMENIYFGMYV